MARGRPVHLLFLAFLGVLLLSSCPSGAFEIPSRNGTDASSDGPLEVEPGELVLAVVVMRHGDRAPQRHAPAYVAGDRSSLEGDVFFVDNSQWSVDYGQLTELGMEQTRQFGRELRRRYIVSRKGKPREFLSGGYKHAETHVRSVDVDRSLVSAMHVMLGLYEEPSELDDIKENFVRNVSEAAAQLSAIRGSLHDRVVVPVHTVEYARDALMDSSSRVHCPRFMRAGAQMLDTSFCRGAIMRNTELLDALPRLTGRDTSGMNFEELVDLIGSLRDLRVCQRAHDVKQPENVTRFDQALDDIVARVAIAKWDLTGLGGLVGGRLLRAIANRMLAVKGLVDGDVDVTARSREECNARGSDTDEDGSCPRKLVLYVGHDTTVFDLRSALGLKAVVTGQKGGGVAPYASHVILELRRQKAGKKRSSRTLFRDGLLGQSAREPVAYEYSVNALTGSHSASTQTETGPFCSGKKRCSMEQFLEFVDGRVPKDINAACDVRESPSDTAQTRAAVGVRDVFGMLLATAIGLIAGLMVGLTVRRASYTPIPSFPDSR